ncbi:crimpy [Haematobia irritans]|uniref:crimpy n=1 Tax=Haematobia irritans TaxID=7368 RepID=UPI003F4F5C2E
MSSKTQFCFLNLRTYLIYLCCYLLVVVAAGSRVVNGLKCYCNPKECDVIRSLDCPGKGLIVLDPCNCCPICAKTVGEVCGGPGDFSGRCEPPLKCVAKLPTANALGVCMDLSFSSTSTSTSYHHHFNHENCTKSERIRIKKGCEIIDKRCHCWPTLKVCRNQVNTGSGSRILRWHFKTLEDCQVNLVSLIKAELDFDEDYTIAPNLFSNKKTRRRKKFRTKIDNDVD